MAVDFSDAMEDVSVNDVKVEEAEVENGSAILRAHGVAPTAGTAIQGAARSLRLP